MRNDKGEEFLLRRNAVLLDPRSGSGMTSGLNEVGGLMNNKVVCLCRWFIYWIPAFAGMTCENGAGMTKGRVRE